MSSINKLAVSLTVSISILLCNNTQVQASVTDGKCAGYSFPLRSDGITINTTLPLRVLRQDAPVYYGPHGNSLKKKLKFGDILKAIRIDANAFRRGRIHIGKYGARPGSSSQGWMDREDLLCVSRPLRNENGLERKVFIRTVPEIEMEAGSQPSAQPYKITVYPSPGGTSCNGKCRYLSRFEMYYVVAEDQTTKRYLLADQYNLTEAPPLVGWVDAGSIIPWNTSLQIRPAEDVNHITASPRKKSSGKEGIVFAGGKIWYKFPYHLPLLEITEYEGTKVYRVAAPGIGMRGFENPNTAPMEKFKQVDIFFLLPDTFSMKDLLGAAKTLADHIADTLQENPAYKGTHFRFGFRVYRDDFAGNKGIGEGLPLTGPCELRSDYVKVNREKFRSKLYAVHTSIGDIRRDDGYPENLFEGLHQAARDMAASCSENLKLLFVIADSGDNTEEAPARVIDSLTKNSDNLPVLFFVQPPKDPSKADIPAYRDAYERFGKQARAILTRVYAKLPGEVDLQNHLLFLQEESPGRIKTELEKTVLGKVIQYSRSDIINEVLLRIRNGESIAHLIDNELKTGDLPGLYWQLFKEKACPKLGPRLLGSQCREQKSHRIIDAYIPVSKETVEEIWISERDLHAWITILRPLTKLRGAASVQKEGFIRALAREIQEHLGDPPLEERRGNLSRQVLKRRIALPIRKHSPLMQYTLEEIRGMENCEFNRLVNWVNGIHRVLIRVVGAPTYKVSFSLEDFQRPCHRISAKGNNLKRIKLDRPRPLEPNNESNYSYAHAFRGERIYSIPTNFLP
ncbi:MAG: hypothetical protein GY862_17370 [Gammaproteobacteria bacterium]|nr:hypothetical protein [Gammaproteobacteria bacterium]